MLLLMAMLIPKHGLQGAALARLVYGPITCLAYLSVVQDHLATGDSHMSIAVTNVYRATTMVRTSSRAASTRR